MTPHDETLDLDTARLRLAGARGREFWRSLEELAQTPEFLKLLEREQPQQVGPWVNALDRRKFLMLMGASLALAGLSGCGVSQAPRERIFPYVEQPEEITPGRPLYFATAMPLGGYGQGVLVESHEGRPTKVEGNPQHPSSPLPPDSPEHVRFGPTDVYSQASILGLYDPDRAQAVTHLSHISTWDNLGAALRAAVHGRPQQAGPPRVRILTETVTSPTLAHQLRELVRPRGWLQRVAVKWHVHEPLGRANTHEGARQAFGEIVDVRYHFERADVVLALDADFLACGPGHVRHVRDFCSRRRAEQGQRERMNCLYVVESTPSTTGAMADHRLPLRSGLVKDFARAVAAAVRGVVQGQAGAALDGLGDAPAVAGVPQGWVAALARDLTNERRRGHSLVIAGETQLPYVHALAHALNEALGNVGTTVEYTDPVAVTPPGERTALADLVADMRAGHVDVLLILGGNPVYTAPADIDFAGALDRVGLRVHLGLYEDETSATCHWHVPEAHYLESWGDVRGPDGTVSILQPLIAPLYNGRTAHDLLGALGHETQPTTYERVRRFWQSPDAPVRPGGDFEAWWRRALHDGVVAGSRLEPRRRSVRSGWAGQGAGEASGQALEIVFRQDPTLYDGRFANNGWLQELPKPLTRLTWDNAALLSPATAVRLGFAAAGSPEQANDLVIVLEYQGRRLEAPVLVAPGHADDSVTVHLGHGRTRAGHVGTGVGFNAYALRTAAAPWLGGGLVVRSAGRRHELALTQHHHLMHNRSPVRTGTVDHPPHPQHGRRELTLYDEGEHLHAPNQWGMVIDLTACTGCGACVVACQAENNIPVVGKDQVGRGREMHWLRIDSYYDGAAANPKTYFQPVPCMHCENAPCELVCPVEATAHSDDGLNDMVYNRCVGTRYCSNNCPYKVRRFNFLAYSDFATESLRLGRNPEVTVRSRGVMEKCTYCVQRIRNVQIDARRTNRAVRDGEVETACQSACPARAIVFGDLADGASKVKRLRDEAVNYDLLPEQNTRPRTTYLAALKNPNPEIEQLERGS
jgi:molybdopterin-containing oxidoreductase family iron-sulfur binding subunit